MASSKQDEGMNISDTFDILEVDPDGKKFDKVSRIVAHSSMYDLDLVLDVRACVVCSLACSLGMVREGRVECVDNAPTIVISYHRPAHRASHARRTVIARRSTSICIRCRLGRR